MLTALCLQWRLLAMSLRKGHNGTFLYTSGGGPIYYHGPHESCIISGGPQNQVISPKILPLSNNEEEWLILT